MYKEFVDFREHYAAYGIFCLVNAINPVSLIHSYSLDIFNTLEITQKFISGVLCIGLLFYEVWPIFLYKQRKWYWFITLTYTLPFLSSSMVLISNFNNFFVTSFSLSIFLLAILANWLNFIIMLTIGVILSVVVYVLNFGVGYLSIDYRILETIYVLVFSTIIALFFCRKQQDIQILKLRQMYLLASSIAHEIRTPLSTLLGNIKLLEKGKNNFETHEQDIVNDIKNNISQCHENINSILYSFKEEKDLKLQRENVANLVVNIVDTYPFLSEEKKLIKVNIKKSKSCIMVSKLLLMQVINNLITNALHSIKKAEKGSIVISLKIQEKTAKISLKDTGIGMSKEVVENLFIPFVTNKNSGNGIGLAYSKIIISKMKGEINCFSVDKKYTQFIIEFPTL